MAFSSASNVSGSDNSVASAQSLVALLGSVQTQYLKVTGFNFSIPANSIICNVTVHVRRKAEGLNPGASIKDDVIRVVKDGSLLGNNVAKQSSWPNNLTTESYSGGTSYWGVSLTPQDVNDPSFGVAISAELNTHVSAFPRAEIDHISMVVEYQPVSTLPFTVEKFTSNIQKNLVTCEWSMAEEEAGGRIILQQSTNNRDWKDLSSYTVSVHATNTNYKQANRLPAKGTYFYRLKTVSKEGKTTYSKTNSVYYTTNGEVKVYPTVAKSMLYVENVDPSDKVQVYNFSNQLVQTSTVAVKEGLIAVRISELPKGMYLLKVGKTTKRFIKD